MPEEFITDEKKTDLAKIPPELQLLAEEARKYKNPKEFIDTYGRTTDYWGNKADIKEYGYLKVGDFIEVVPSGFDHSFKAFVTGFMEVPKFGRGSEMIVEALPENNIQSIRRSWLRIYGKDRDKVKLIKRYDGLKSFWQVAQKKNPRGGEAMEEFIIDEAEKEKVQIIKGKIKKDILFLTFPEMEVEKGGIVVDEEKALSTRCHGYRIPLDGETSEMVWSLGIIGCLSKTEKVEYCKLGTDWKEPSEKLRERMRILHEAGIFRR